jgi:hypothetical protein
MKSRRLSAIASPKAAEALDKGRRGVFQVGTTLTYPLGGSACLRNYHIYGTRHSGVGARPTIAKEFAVTESLFERG